MKLTPKEKRVLLAVLLDRERLASMDPAGHGIPRGMALGAHRLRIRDARQGLVPLNLCGWLGHTPTASECVMYSRTYERLEIAGLVERCNLYRGTRTTHLKLTPAGEAEARRIEGKA